MAMERTAAIMFVIALSGCTDTVAASDQPAVEHPAEPFAVATDVPPATQTASELHMERSG